MAQTNLLKALIQRLMSTPVEDLPNIAYFLASSISGCLICPQNPGTDRTALLHKLKARISSLLQDRTPEGRFTAVVVAKAVIEAGGREILVDIEPWIRGLIGILNKSDPLATKRLSVLTISRAFILTQDYPSILRDITTPLLPSFNTACLAAIRPKTTKSDKGTHNVLSPLLPTVLQCWIELLRHHPATFRPFITRFRPICLSLLSDAITPDSISRSAGALLVALHYSAPKNTGASEWSQLCQDAIQAAHATAGSLFRSVHEDWISTEADIRQAEAPARADGELPGAGPDVLGLAEWRGMRDGSKRISRLLSILEILLSSVTAAEVFIPLSGVMNLCVRLLALTIPGTNKDSPYTLRTNPEYGKDEREALWAEIPTVHANCLNLLAVIVRTLQLAILPISKSITDQLIWVFDAEQDLPNIRVSSYELLKVLLPMVGPTAADTDVKTLSGMIRRACRDLMPTSKLVESHVGDGIVSKTTSINVDSNAGQTKSGVELKFSSEHSALQSEAGNLISSFLQYVPAHLVPNNLRIEIDRAAVLSQDKRALLASVLNPAMRQKGQHAPASLLPFLAHAAPGLEAEALLRPRMAVIIDKNSNDMGQDFADFETDEVAKNIDPTNGSGLLDRLDKALTIPGQVNTDTNGNLGRPETHTEAGSNPMIEDETSNGSIKRDFTAMNGNSLNGWHTGDSSVPQNTDTSAKKPRIDGHATIGQPEVDEDSAEENVAPHGIIRSNAHERDSVQVQHIQPEVSVHTELLIEAKPQPNVKAALKGKGAAVDLDDSDSDIPEINIEPDTDEDEDEDEDMYG